MAYEDRTYHGIQGAGSGDDGKRQPVRLLVETPEEGPTQRGPVTRVRHNSAA